MEAEDRRNGGRMVSFSPFFFSRRTGGERRDSSSKELTPGGCWGESGTLILDKRGLQMPS
jgi:hypothetical protein